MKIYYGSKSAIEISTKEYMELYKIGAVPEVISNLVLLDDASKEIIPTANDKMNIKAKEIFLSPEDIMMLIEKILNQDLKGDADGDIFFGKY